MSVLSIYTGSCVSALFINRLLFESFIHIWGRT